VRHYFGYDDNGELKAIEIYGPTGWPSDQCMADPNCRHKGVTSLRESRAKTAPSVIGWVLYDCPCDADSGHLVTNCVCFNKKFAESYVDTQMKLLISKPLRTVLIDNVPISHGEIVTRNPGTSVVLKIAAIGVPNGEKAHCTQKGIVDLTLDDEWDLLFENNLSETKTLITPAQGSKGAVHIGGKLLRPMTFCLRGFAT